MKYNIVDFGAKPRFSTISRPMLFRRRWTLRGIRREGIVVVPAGDYTVSSLRMYSNTTLYLCSGAKILGSRECGDYGLIEPPAGHGASHRHRNDPSIRQRKRPYALPACYSFGLWGGKHLHCRPDRFDDRRTGTAFHPKGEEGFRGPHGIFLSNCRNVTPSNYTIQSTGNFTHQLDRCSNVTFANVTMLAGHDRGPYSLLRQCPFCRLYHSERGRLHRWH